MIPPPYQPDDRHDRPTIIPPTGGAGAGGGATGSGTPSGKPDGRIGPYRLISILGEGGFGTVYLAEQSSPHRRVAVKVLRAGVAGPQSLSRFAHEAETLGRLQHPGIAQVFEAGFFDPRTGDTVPGEALSGAAAAQRGVLPFFAMEYIEGLPLNDHVKAGNLSRPERLELFMEICAAVQHAHTKGVVHRDLKPANILVDVAGRPKVLDFGVARVTADGVQRTMQTDVGQLVGTIGYMSPEQIAADPAEIDTRSDVYGLGVILYQLLSGAAPHRVEGRLLHEATRIICEEPPTRLGTIDRSLRGDLDTIVAKAIEKNKSRRYQSAADLASDLRRFVRNEPIIARPPSTWYQARKFAARNKPLVAGIAASFALLCAGVIATSYWAVRATNAESTATTRRLEAEAATKTAQEQRDLAKREAEKAVAVTSFLEDTISAADPANTGRDVRMADLLDSAAKQVDRGYADKPEVAAALRSALARAYFGLGMNAEALPLIDRAIEGFTAAEGPAGVQTRTSRLYRGRILRNLAKFDEAREIFETLVAEETASVGPNDQRTRRALAGLGWSYADQGRLPDAERIFSDLALRTQTALGPDARETLADRRHAAEVILEAGRPADAEPILLDIAQRLERLGDDGKSDLIPTRASLAQLYRAKGDYQRAIELGRAVVEAEFAQYGPDHPWALQRQVTFARTLIEAGQLDEAITRLRVSYEGQAKRRGPEHFDTLTAAAFLADALQAKGRPEEAYPLRRTVADARSKQFGEDHPQTLVAWTNTAFVLMDLSRFDEAEAILLELLARRERLNGPESAEVGLTLSMLGSVQLRAGDAPKAEPYLRRCVAIREKLLPEGSGIRGFSMSSLGDALRIQRKFDEAEPLATTGAEWVLADPRSPARNKKDAIDRAVALYTDWGKPDQAAAWNARRPPTPAPAAK